MSVEPRPEAQRLYTHVERGTVGLVKYHRRKVFWGSYPTACQWRMDIRLAVDRVYEAYGRSTSVTMDLTALQDRKTHNGRSTHQDWKATVEGFVAAQLQQPRVAIRRRAIMRAEV
jgi:hypothetical protein